MANNTGFFYDRIRFILEYFEFVIGIIGVIGNALVIIVFSRKTLRKYSYSFYCLIMAISDICLMSYIFMEWSGYYFGAYLEKAAPLFCKIVRLIPYYFTDFSIHLLTIIAIDRMLTIVYPRRFLIIKKRWFQSLIVTILMLIIALANIIIPLNSNLIEANSNNLSQAIRICAIAPEIINIEIWVSITNFVLVNFIINNWLNIKTIRFIMASRKRVNSSLSSRDRKFAICSICLNLASMTFKLPFFICLLIIGYSSNISIDEIKLIVKITSIITYLDNGFSFFINIAVNTIFYKEFIELFGIKKVVSNGIHNKTANNNLKTITNNSL